MNTELQQIIQGCIQQNRLMQKQLYTSCYSEMMKICTRYTSDNAQAASLYNDAMYKVFKNIAGYKETGNMMGWVKRIVIHTCIDFVRLKQPFSTIELKETIETDDKVEEKILEKMSRENIRQLILSLPEKSALVFNLFVYEGYSHPEIAVLLQIPPGTCRYYLSEARRLLKDKLQNNISSLEKAI